MVNHVCLMETFLVTIFFMTVNREKRSAPTWIMKSLTRFENCFKRIKVENEKKRLSEASFKLFSPKLLVKAQVTQISFNLEKPLKEEEIDMYLDEGWINDNGWVKLEDFITKAMLYCQIFVTVIVQGMIHQYSRPPLVQRALQRWI